LRRVPESNRIESNESLVGLQHVLDSHFLFKQNQDRHFILSVFFTLRASLVQCIVLICFGGICVHKQSICYVILMSTSSSTSFLFTYLLLFSFSH